MVDNVLLMKVSGIEWDENNRAHFKEHGRASREQVEDILSARANPSRAAIESTVRNEARFRFEGETRHGRFLVVIAAQRPENVWRPITCWPLSGVRLQSYLAWRKRVSR